MHLYLFFILLFQHTPLHHTAVIPGKALNGTLTIGYLLSWSHEWATGPYVGSAITIGIEEIKRRQLLPGYEIEWILKDTWCQPHQGTKAAIAIWSESEDLDVFIGPSCSTACQFVSSIAASWGIPVISYSCSSVILSDTKEYPNFARTANVISDYAVVAHHIADLFEWDRVGVISDVTLVYMEMTREFEKLMKQSGKKTFTFTTASTISDTKREENILRMRQILRVLKENCRVIFVSMYTLDVRNILVIAHEENMVKGFIYIGSDAELPWDVDTTFRPDVGLEIYEGVIDLEVGVRRGPQWDSFRQEAIDAFQSPEFDGWNHVGPNASIDEISNYAGYIHDALLLWAYGVNRTLEQGLPPDDGFTIIQNILEFSFEGISGRVTMDSQGNRKADFDITMMQNGQPVHIMSYSAAEERLIKLYKPKFANNWDGLIWPGGVTSVPSDSPPCGWKNEKCHEGTAMSVKIAAICITLVVVAIVCAVVIAIYVSKKRFEKQLQSAVSSIISWDQIQEQRGIHSSYVTIGSSSVSRGRQLTMQEHVFRYNSQLVTITKINTNGQLDPHDRKFLLELKTLKELHHENLNQFIGICLESSHECVIMGYASRGTLEDIIMTNDFALSWDFRISVITDVINGMNYLHTSYGWHGSLSSMTCVVDHQWICKVTDYGFRYQKKFSSCDIEQNNEEYALLWVAPELLQEGPGTDGSKKGDVYSFAIICQEVFTGDTPYAGLELTTNEIVTAFKNKSDESLRPIISEDACNQATKELIKECWCENPNDRPTFGMIASSMIKINGNECSLVDSMIARLAVHSTRLEVQVAERTTEIVDEKQKVEFLLAELIPLTIIESLKHGRTIEPEAFDNVSIFFSDVVSFTRISAAGTPIDVVRMLNMMYTVFDDIASKFEVYKVATIGDAYFVASGVPIRNGQRHATEICDMAVQLLKICRTMSIPHLPQEMLKLRIGVHCGPCLAGVVGLKMPRYLLFGETVDIAEMLESSGEASKIHVSQDVVDLLPKNKFSLMQRSEPCHLKGYALMPLVTYWLDAK